MSWFLSFLVFFIGGFQLGAALKDPLSPTTWTLESNSDFLDFDVDDFGYIYYVSNVNQLSLVKIHGANGDTVWSVPNLYYDGYSGAGIAVSDDSNHVYAVTIIYISKYSTIDGSLLWKVSNGVSGAIHPVVDRDNTLYVAGSSASFVTKYDSNGVVVWRSNRNDGVYGVDIAAHGNYIYVIGLRGNDFEVTKLRCSDGVTEWSLSFDSGVPDYGYGIAAANGFVYITGQTKGSLFGTPSHDNKNNLWNLFVAKLDMEDGATVWGMQSDYSLDSMSYSIDVDSKYVYVAGEYDTDYLFTVLDIESGSELSRERRRSSIPSNVAVDTAGNVVLSGDSFFSKNAFCKEHNQVHIGSPFCSGCEAGYYGKYFDCSECPGISYSMPGSASCSLIKLTVPIYASLLILIPMALFIIAMCYHLKLSKQHIYVVVVSSIDFLSDIATILTSSFYNRLYFTLIVVFVFVPAVQLILHMRKQIYKHKRSIWLFFAYPKHILFDMVWVDSREGIPYIRETRIFPKSVQHVHSLSLSILLVVCWFFAVQVQICHVLVWCLVHAVYLLPTALVHLPYHGFVFLVGYALMQTKLLAHPVIHQAWQRHAFTPLAEASATAAATSIKNSEADIDLGLYNAAVVAEVVLESIPQLILQSLNSSLLDQFGVISITSIASSSFSILSCFYKVCYYYYWHSVPFNEIPLPMVVRDSLFDTYKDKMSSTEEVAKTELVSSPVVSVLVAEPSNNLEKVKEDVAARWRDWFMETAALGDLEATLYAAKLVDLNVSTVAKLRHLFETESPLLKEIGMDEYDHTLIRKALIIDV